MESQQAGGRAHDAQETLLMTLNSAHASCWAAAGPSQSPQAQQTPSAKSRLGRPPLSQDCCQLSALPEPYTVTMHVVTFNMSSTVPDSLPSELLGPSGAVPGLYVFATQESCTTVRWEHLLEAALAARGQYEFVTSTSLRGMALYVYVASTLAHAVTGVQASAVPTGLGNVLGNKVCACVHSPPPLLTIAVPCSAWISTLI